MNTVISVENVSKRYRLGVIGGGTLHGDASRWWARVRGKPDPSARINELTDCGAHGEAIWALRDVSLRVEAGEVIGIIGRNGTGKSTLLKVLSRVTAPTAGIVRMRGRVGSLLEVGTGFHPELTGRENIYLNGSILGMRRRDITARLDEIIEFAEIQAFVDTAVKRYSSGMYVRLAFAVAAHLQPEILLVDEVLAVGDIAFQQKCLGKMKDVAAHGRTVLFVSHNMASVRALCTRAVLLSRGLIELDGDTDEAIRAYLPIVDVSARTDLRTLETRVGSGRARFVEVALANQNGDSCSVFHIGDDIRIDIAIQANEPMRTAFLSLGIVASDGAVITTLSPHEDSGFTIGSIDKTVVVRAIIRDQRFYPGNYSVYLWLGAVGGGTLDSMRGAAGFQVSPGGASVARQLGQGMVYMTADWSRVS